MERYRIQKRKKNPQNKLNMWNKPTNHPTRTTEHYEACHRETQSELPRLRNKKRRFISGDTCGF